MVLKGEKTVLRHHRLGDAPRFVSWFKDHEVIRFLGTRGITLSQEIRQIRRFQRERKRKRRDNYYFAIDALNGAHIGGIDLHGVNWKHGFASLGIMIGDKNYWNKGYGTDAMQTILRFGFERLRLHRIELDVFDYNKRAIKVYKRLGFKTEGVLRDRFFYNGKFYNFIRMSILYREWKNRVLRGAS